MERRTEVNYAGGVTNLLPSTDLEATGTAYLY